LKGDRLTVYDVVGVVKSFFQTPPPLRAGARSRAPREAGRSSKTLDAADGSPPCAAGRSGASSQLGICWFTSTKARSLESYGEFNELHVRKMICSPTDLAEYNKLVGDPATDKDSQ